MSRGCARRKRSARRPSSSTLTRRRSSRQRSSSYRCDHQGTPCSMLHAVVWILKGYCPTAAPSSSLTGQPCSDTTAARPFASDNPTLDLELDPNVQPRHIRQVESKSASQAVERAGKAVVGSSRSLEKAEGAAEKLRREAEKTLEQVSSPGELDTNPSRTWPLSQATAVP